jgi:hypothetical protein
VDTREVGGHRVLARHRHAGLLLAATGEQQPECDDHHA